MKTISVVIPAYNEEKRLRKTLTLWKKLVRRPTSNQFSGNFKIAEIIVVDDGSQDKTGQITESFRKYLPIEAIKISPNQGKGKAVRTGVKESIGDLIFIYDADAAVLPQEINKLLFYAAKYDIIIGSRTAAGAKAKISFIRRLVGICFHLLCRPLLPDIKDASCGAKLFSRAAAKEIFGQQKINRFAFDIEILWLAEKLNYKIKEVGLVWQEIADSKVRIFRDGWEMFISALGIYKRHLLG